MRVVYLDNNATTPVHPEVLEAIIPYYKEDFGNASSIHRFGRSVRVAVEEAREQAAKILGSDPSEIIFTGGGSESDNFAIKGIAFAHMDKGKHIITSQIEHPAVLDACRYLEKIGFEATYVSVDEHGMVNPEEIRNAIRDDTILVSIMHANNEVGTIQPLKEISEIVKERDIVFHTDAVQSLGKIDTNVDSLGVDLLSFSAHKLYGPKGVGGIYIRRGTTIHNLIHGGHQERNLRAGTENVAGIVALGKCCEIALRDYDKERDHLYRLRKKLQKGMEERIPQVRCNGHPTLRLPTTVNMSFGYIEGEALLINMDLQGIAVSSGSACTSGSTEPSHVLAAMKVPPEFIQGSLRFSLGRENTDEDIDYVIEVLPPIVERLRAMSPLWKS